LTHTTAGLIALTDVSAEWWEAAFDRWTEELSGVIDLIPAFEPMTHPPPETPLYGERVRAWMILKSIRP
jgi:hypothetical protein